MPALQTLVAVAQHDTGQSAVCGRFLLGLYNGTCYMFDLTEVRRLDSDLLEDCLPYPMLIATTTRILHQHKLTAFRFA